MSQKLYDGADAAFPGKPLPAGTEILAGYVGIPGAHGPDTPHIWSASEWNQYIDAEPGLRLLPVYTHNFPDGDPDADAADAVDACRRLGWAPGMPAPFRRFIAVDIETLVAPDYLRKLGQGIWNRGFRCITYGSSSTVSHNPPFAGYWLANWTGRKPRALGQNQRGIQYAPGGEWDLSIFDQATYDGCGRGARTG